MKEIIIHTEQWFDAAHHLNDYEGNCKNLHGHTYKIEIWVKGYKHQLNKAGILWDFGGLKKLAQKFDHAGDMTELMGINSTAENQVLYFYDELKKQNPKLDFRVRVYEQLEPKKSWAEIGDF